jgi:hypothetical protein
MDRQPATTSDKTAGSAGPQVVCGAAHFVCTLARLRRCAVVRVDGEARVWPPYHDAVFARFSGIYEVRPYTY